MVTRNMGEINGKEYNLTIKDEEISTLTIYKNNESVDITDEDIDFARYLIDDSNVATTKTYSSSKIEELINVIEANITDNETKVELLTSLVNSLINDAQSSTTTTYSSSKIEEITTEINNKISDAKEQLPRRIVVTVDDNGNATFSLSNLPVAEGNFDDEIT